MLSHDARLGLIGGVSWVSTLEYYRRINTYFEDRLGRFHTPDIVLCSLPFDAVMEHQESGDLAAEGALLVEAARVMEGAGVEVGLICSNTTHRTFDALNRDTTVRFLDIVEAMIRTIRNTSVSTVGLLGTKYVMESGSYAKRLEDRGIAVRLPNEEDRDEVHRIIYEELCINDLRDESRSRLRDVVRRLGDEGCESAVLGCTELPLLLSEPEVDGVGLLDSVASHLDMLYELLGMDRTDGPVGVGSAS